MTDLQRAWPNYRHSVTELRIKRDGITQRDGITENVWNYIERDGITQRAGITESVTELHSVVTLSVNPSRCVIPSRFM